MDYYGYVQRVGAQANIARSDLDFRILVPAAIDYAEQRCYRELDLLNTQVTDVAGVVSSGNRSFTLSTSAGVFITVDQLNLLTPAGVLSSAASRIPLLAVSPEVVDATYPSNVPQPIPSYPKYFARRSDTTVILGPAPDAAYGVEVVGIQRPAALSSGNSSTALTRYVPDLFFAATMVFVSDYMRNSGFQADDPQLWEARYQSLFKSAAVEQARAKFQAEGWTSEQPSPVATPARV